MDGSAAERKSFAPQTLRDRQQTSHDNCLLLVDGQHSKYAEQQHGRDSNDGHHRNEQSPDAVHFDASIVIATSTAAVLVRITINGIIELDNPTGSIAEQTQCLLSRR
jgi:hypothetical protein